MNRLAIFDVDGTLTDTNRVDDDCYRATIAEAIGVAESAIDWSGAAHVTDSEIFRWLCAAHRRSEPSGDEMERARSQFVARLTAQLEQAPARFSSIAGAAAVLAELPAQGWQIAVATGGWGPSARLKLSVAELAIDDAVFACADDGRSRADIVRRARDRAEAFYQRELRRSGRGLILSRDRGRHSESRSDERIAVHPRLLNQPASSKNFPSALNSFNVC